MADDASNTTLKSLSIPQPPLTTQTSYSNSHHMRLRQACDGCTAAKVKCDRGRPACQRCLDSDELCQYSPSRRYGKRTRRSGKNPRETRGPSSIQQLGSTLCQSPTGGADSSIMSHSADLFGWDNLDLICAPTETTPPLPSEHELGLSNMLMWTNFDSPNYVSQSDQDSSFSVQASSSERELLEKNDIRSIDTMSRQFVEHTKHEAEHILECEARALNVLTSLQYSPALCTRERRDSTPISTSDTTDNVSLQRLKCSVDSMDTLLATNKAALHELTRLLECRCTQNSHMALLHLTILSKIVFWYGVAVTTRYNSDRVELKPMKIQAGMLDLDDDDYNNLHRVVLSRELQKAENVLQAFEIRFATSDVQLCNKESPWGRLVIRTIRQELESSAHEIERRQAQSF